MYVPDIDVIDYISFFFNILDITFDFIFFNFIIILSRNRQIFQSYLSAITQVFFVLKTYAKIIVLFINLTINDVIWNYYLRSQYFYG